MSTIGDLDPDLVTALRMVHEATAADGPRFLPSTAKTLARMVLCRAFGKPMLELAYLVAIAAACGRPSGRYEAFFWNEKPATPGTFRAHMFGLRERGRLPGTLKLQGDNVSIATDGDPFTVHYTRMPLLVALAEFLMTTVGYQAFDASVGPVASVPVTARKAADVANALSRALHAYLQDRLDTGHTQRKMNAMIEHLKARRRADSMRIDDETIDATSIDDDSILSFWIAWSGSDALEGVRTFRATAAGFLHLRDALTAAQDRTRVERAISIGSDREAGEVDPEAVDAELAELGEENDVIAALTVAPLDCVKFCNQRELGQLETAARYGRHGVSLTCTALRDDVFGDAQARITQALRRGGAWRHDPAGTYRDRAADLRRLDEQVDRMLWASLHVLIELESAAVVDLMQALRPDLDLSGVVPASALDEQSDNVVQFRAVSPEQRFLHLLRSEPDVLGPELAEVAATARRAFGKVARKGFGEDDIRDPSVAVAFRAAPPVLRRLRDLLGGFARQVGAKPDHELDGLFENDRIVFYDQFERLYGGT